ncbi:BTAD domain-containing putative transcriptional regulator [Streptomyces sp. NPDC059072]|uniref:AfsR/SARP family transcriptional regulator n=1 Tax=Streptomyces sp. NPDC059072 TaxID=3346715 RepID=UPI0036C7675D
MPAALLLARGRVVPDTRLSPLLWGARPPATMSAQLHTYVSRLRTLLEPELTLERRGAGYAIRTGDSRFDVAEYVRVDRLGRQALRAHRYEEAGTLLRDALELWRGPMRVNATEHLVQEEVPQWEEARAATLENRIEADLALGHHQRITSELTRLVADFPLRERMRAQVMTALYRCGRQADALLVFHEGRSVLAEELGVEPGHGLRAAHEALPGARLDLAPHPAAEPARTRPPGSTQPGPPPPPPPQPRLPPRHRRPSCCRPTPASPSPAAPANWPPCAACSRVPRGNRGAA